MTDDAYRPDADPAADGRCHEARDDDCNQDERADNECNQDERADNECTNDGDDLEAGDQDERDARACDAPEDDSSRPDEERPDGALSDRCTRALELVALARAVAETLLALARLMRHL